MASDYDYLKASNGSGDAALMHVQSDRLPGATTIDVDVVTNVPTKFVATYGTLGADGLITPSSKRDFKGHLDSGNLIIDAFEPGSTDNGNTEGQVVLVKPNTGWANRVAQAIANITGFGTPEAVHATAVTADSVTAPTGAIDALTGNTVAAAVSLSERGITLATMRKEHEPDFIAAGGVWTADSPGTNRNASMTAVTAYIDGQRGIVGAVTARNFAASVDTYVDILNSSGTFSLVYTTNTTNAAAPALAAHSVRLGIIPAGATSIAAQADINQGQPEALKPTNSNYGLAGIDSLGNRICLRSPYEPLTFIVNITLAGGGDVLTATLPLLAAAKLVISGNTSTEWVNTPSIDTYATLFADGVQLDQKRLDTDGTSKTWISYPLAGKKNVASGARVVKIALTHGGGGSPQFTAASLSITAYPA